MAPVRCALYARVSTDAQVEKYGLGSQLTELRALAKQRGYCVVGEFVDDGVSGATLDRPRLNALRELARGRGTDVVMAHTSDRISRALVDYLLVVEEVQRLGARLEFVSHTPDDTAEGKLREQVLGAVAEFERAKIRERTSRGSREKARRGINPGGGVPFGYRRDETALGGLAVDKAAADCVRRMYSWAAEGASLRAIAARLHAQGFQPPRGSRWERTSVRRILLNPTYLGQGIYGQQNTMKPKRVVRDEAEWIRYAVTPIVSPALAERARAQLRRNVALLGGRPSGRVFLLAGLLRCGRCGRRMHGDGARPTPAYRCDGRQQPEADRCRFQIPAARVDAEAWAALRAVIEDPARLQATAKTARLGIDARRVDAATQLAELRAALAKVEQRRGRLVDLFVDGRVDKAAFDVRERPLKAEAARLAKAVAAAQGQLDAGQAAADGHAALVKYCALIARGIERLDAAGRQAFVRKVVTGAVADAGRVVLEGTLDPTNGPPPGRAIGQVPENRRGQPRRLPRSSISPSGRGRRRRRSAPGRPRGRRRSTRSASAPRPARRA